MRTRNTLPEPDVVQIRVDTASLHRALVQDEPLVVRAMIPAQDGTRKIQTEVPLSTDDKRLLRNLRFDCYSGLLVADIPAHVFKGMSR